MSIENPREELRKHIYAFWSPPLVYITAKLGIADILLDGPKQSKDLAPRVGVNASALHRVLRAMVTIGLLTEGDDGRFALTAMGELLQSNRSDSMRSDAIMVGEVLPAWGGLLRSVQTGETAFDHVFGIGLFDYLAQNAAIGKHFNQLMARGTEQIAAAAVAAYDFSTVQRIIDVGGGYGGLLKAILSAHSAVRGVLFDLPHVIESARELFESAKFSERCELIPGDFLESVPESGDAYILQFTIHDWDDERATQILKNCRRAITEQGKLLLVERLMPERVEQAPATVQLDLIMLVCTGGRERTEAEYRSLFAAADFQLTKITPTQGDWSVIEGVPIRMT